ncbi:hypothetical protein BBJ28_00022253 [Nothophytophthora sp. Chile5]|nr:hypothetical protein BBJ28_00022253 [Nothophytophthora sp. Chile5]
MVVPSSVMAVAFFGLLQENLSLAVVEVTTYLCVFLLMLHVHSSGKRNATMLVAAALQILVVELVFYSQTRWHAQALVMLIPERLPLYVVLLQAQLYYIAFVATSRLRIDPFFQPFAMGTLLVLLAFPFELLGTKFLWWTWHDTDPLLADRLMGVPCHVLFYYFFFAFGFLCVHHILRSLLLVGDYYEDEHWKAEWSYSLFMPIFGTLFAMGFLILGYHATVHLMGIQAQRALDPVDAYDSDWLYVYLDHAVNQMVFVHYLVLVLLVLFTNPVDIVSLGHHQPLGNCQEEEHFYSLVGMQHRRKRYLCVHDFDEEFNLCNYPVTQLLYEDSWYMICGRGYNAYASYVALVVGSFLLLNLLVFQALKRPQRTRNSLCGILFACRIQRCVDCDAPYPQWATVSYGTFMCLECSGRHRGLGVHISFVRSVTMDSWTDKQVLQMQKGGNEAFREAFATAGVPTDLSISEKYNTPQAEAYRQRLTAVVEGRAPPSLPRYDPSMRKPASSSFSSASYAGGGAAGGDTRGVEALKGESEQDYVARQIQLREEARARMAAKFGGNGMQGIGSGGETRAPPSASGGLGDLSGAFSYLSTTVTTAASSAASLVKDKDLGSKVSSGWSYVQSTISDPALSQNVKSSASTGWSALSSGASMLLHTAQTVVDSTVGSGSASSGSGGLGSAFPRTNAELPATGKYQGMGSSSMDSSSRDHDNDSWLDSQLGGSQSSNGSSSFSNGGSSFSSQQQQPKAAPTPDLFGSSGSSTNGSSHNVLGLSSSSVASATSSNGSATATAPPPAPVAKKEAPKKDVDFFGEFGF